MAHIGEEIALGAIGEFGLDPRLLHLFFGRLALGYVRIERHDAAVGHAAATDLQRMTAQRGKFDHGRDIAIEPVEAFACLALGVIDRAEIAAHGLKQQDFLQ